MTKWVVQEILHSKFQILFIKYRTANELFNSMEAAKTFYEGFVKPSESQHEKMPTALATVGNLRE